MSQLVAKYVLVLLASVGYYNALPCKTLRERREAPGTSTNESHQQQQQDQPTTVGRHPEAAPVKQANLEAQNQCLLLLLSPAERAGDCSDELSQAPAKVLDCLNNCANCARQWRAGVYNGHGCAMDCVQQVESPTEALDPDCNLMKYFNSTLLTQVL